MSVTYPESLRAYVDRIQLVSRFGRKPEPVVYLDMETRSTLSVDPGSDVLCGAYKIDDGPVIVLPWEAAIARGDWNAADRLRAEMFDYIKRQHQLNYYEDLAWIDKSWLTKKFLTFAAWARKIFKRSTIR
jgi:hypothetical protein